MPYGEHYTTSDNAPGFAVDATEIAMVAFRGAREVGADGIEIDVCLTKNRQIVTMHDEQVNRTVAVVASLATFHLRDYYH